MLTSLLLSAVVCLSSDPAETALAAEADAADEAVDAEAADEADEADAEIPPEVQAALERLDPSARATFEAMDEAQVEALFERFQRGETLSADEQAIVTVMMEAFASSFEAELTYQTGDVELERGLAVLHLGEGFRYLGPDDAERLLVEAWGNPPGTKSLGMLVPTDVSPLDPQRGWGIVITYAADGYVDDEDAEDIDYDDLLEQMQEGTEAENASRRSQGYPPMHLVGWAESPHYDGAEHRLYWAKELSVDGSPEHSLNYSIRVLGRRGVLELNAVASMELLPAVKPRMEDVLARVEFNTGNRYEDFDPDLDRVAAYGIGGLIAGKVLAKAGIFAVILKFLVAAKKLLLLGAVAVGVALKRWFGRR